VRMWSVQRSYPRWPWNTFQGYTRWCYVFSWKSIPRWNLCLRLQRPLPPVPHVFFSRVKISHREILALAEVCALHVLKAGNGSRRVTHDPVTHPNCDPWPTASDPWPISDTIAYNHSNPVTHMYYDTPECRVNESDNLTISLAEKIYQ